MILQTERLTLRRFTDSDVDMLASWLADPEFTRYLGGVRDRAGSEELYLRVEAHWAEHGFGPLAVTDRETGELIGRGGIAFHRSWPDDPEVGWWIVPAWQGQGLATEGGAASVAWGFGELGFRAARLDHARGEPRVARRDGEARFRPARARAELSGASSGCTRLTDPVRKSRLT